MTAFAVRRSIRGLLTLWVVVSAVFVSGRLSGDPIMWLLPDDASAAQKRELRSYLGLDQSIAEQYVRYLHSLTQGEFGSSYIDHRPVVTLFLERVPATLKLAGLALGVSLLIGVPVGVVAALSRNGPLDRFVMSLAFLGQALPNFVLGIALILIFSLFLRWLPSGGQGDWRHYLMPVLTLGTVEEYEAARRQWSRRRKNKPSVMFYFRRKVTAAISALDADQLRAVQTFKKRVFDNGLAREYDTVLELEGLLREHLTKEARAILKRSGPSPKTRRTAAPPETAPPAKKPAAKSAAGRQKAAQVGAPRASRLPVPTVPKLLTASDREGFARKALTTALREFRAAAEVFNADHPHARITVKQEDKDAFTAVGEANGEHVVSARVRLEAPSWGTAWTLSYETGRASFSSEGPLYYQTEARINTADDGYVQAYTSSFGAFPDGHDRTEKPLDVARAFWDRFVRAFTALR